MMDGYIKQQNEKIRSIKHIIWAKYGITLLLIVFILFTLVLMLTEQPPEKWTRKEIVFSHLSRECIGLSRFDSDVLFTENGEKYAIRKDSMADGLTAGNTYILVYSRANTMTALNSVEALSDENTIYQNLNVSIARWEKERTEAIHIILALCMTEMMALFLIDRLWCKKEHAQVRELQAKIARRKDYSAKRGS